MTKSQLLRLLQKTAPALYEMYLKEETRILASKCSMISKRVRLSLLDHRYTFLLNEQLRKEVVTT